MKIRLSTISDRPRVFSLINRHSKIGPGLLPEVIPVVVDDNDEIISGVCIYYDISTPLAMASWTFADDEKHNTIKITKSFMMLFDALPEIVGESTEVLLANVNPVFQRMLKKRGYIINHTNTQAFIKT